MRMEWEAVRRKYEEEIDGFRRGIGNGTGSVGEVLVRGFNDGDAYSSIDC